MVPKIGPDGKILVTPEGNPMYEYVSSQPQAAPLATMIRQYERGEAVDPTKLMEAVVNAFTKGVEVTATAGRGRGGDPDQMLVLQEKLESARHDAIKAQFDGIQRGWEHERQFFRQTIEQMSPDKFAEQVPTNDERSVPVENEGFPQIEAREP